MKKKGKGKGTGKNKQDPWLLSLADKLANATGSTRSAVMAQTKGKGKKKTKKGKGKGKTGKGKHNDGVCMDFLNGTCQRDNCKFKHE